MRHSELTTFPEATTGGASSAHRAVISYTVAAFAVLFLLATVISGKAVLPTAQATDIHLTALAILLTLVYLLGIAFRPRGKVLGMGIDPLLVLILYAVGTAGLFAIGGI